MQPGLRSPLSFLRRAVRIALALAACAPLAAAQSFDGCGTIVPGVTCPKLFAPDSGGLYVLQANLSGFNVGDHLHVVGTIDPSCITICQQGNGCINPTSIGPCAPPATAFCFGDGTQGACPCSNQGAAGRGCENSAATGGAVLTASGTTSPDTLVLTSSGELPTALSIFLQGDQQLALPVVFGDGLRCVGGNLKRLYVKNAVGGVVSAPTGGDPSITAQSAALGDPFGPGAVRFYQVYYRDPDHAFCPAPPGNSWNVSNGLAVAW